MKANQDQPYPRRDIWIVSQLSEQLEWKHTKEKGSHCHHGQRDHLWIELNLLSSLDNQEKMWHFRCKTTPFQWPTWLPAFCPSRQDLRLPLCSFLSFSDRPLLTYPFSDQIVRCIISLLGPQPQLLSLCWLMSWAPPWLCSSHCSSPPLVKMFTTCMIIFSFVVVAKSPTSVPLLRESL